MIAARHPAGELVSFLPKGVEGMAQNPKTTAKFDAADKLRGAAALATVSEPAYTEVEFWLGAEMK